MEDYEVTENLLAPKKEENNPQKPEPMKPMKNSTKIFFIVLAAVLAVSCILAYGMRGQDTEDSDPETNGSKYKYGNYNVNLAHYSTQLEPYAGGRIAANGDIYNSYLYLEYSYDKSYNRSFANLSGEDATADLNFNEEGGGTPSLNVYREYIYYCSDDRIRRMKTDGSNRSVVCKKIDGMTPRLFHVYDGKIYAFFADDNYLYAGAEEEPECALYVMDLDGGNPKLLTNDICSATFSIDQDTIYYRTANSDDAGNLTRNEIMRMDLDGGNVGTILDLMDSQYDDAYDFYVHKGKLYYNAGTQEGVYDIETGDTNMIDSPDGGKVLQYIADTKYKRGYLLTEVGGDDSAEVLYSVYRTSLDGSGAKRIFREEKQNLPPSIYQASDDGVYLLDCSDDGDDVEYFASSYDDEMQEVAIVQTLSKSEMQRESMPGPKK